VYSAPVPERALAAPAVPPGECEKILDRQTDGQTRDRCMYVFPPDAVSVTTQDFSGTESVYRVVLWEYSAHTVSAIREMHLACSSETALALITNR